MGRNLMAQIAKYLSSHRRRKIGYWALCSLGAVVVFCTTYALILPAITMSNEPICGMEAHAHDESCWTLEAVAPETELVCEEWKEADVVFHTHGALCRSSEGKLICMLEEQERHVHAADCYADQMELICGKTAGEPEEPGEAPAAPRPAVKAHTHTDSCYSFQRGELTCVLEEAAGHTHTDACYESQPSGEMIQTCPYTEGQIVSSIFDADNGTFADITHAHTAECYEAAMDHVLVCGQEESEGHLHNDDCYSWERALTCPETETPETEPEAVPEEVVEVHVHTEDCYRITAIQVCGQEELELHTHGPACYDTIQTDDGMGGFEAREILVCELPAVIEHQHTEACVQQQADSLDEGGERQVMVRTCGLTVHVHTDDCFLPAGPDPDPYYCGLAEHFHTAECYFESGELRCHIPEHQHEDACLDPESAPNPVYPLFPEDTFKPAYECGIEEHQHTDDCWVDGVLACRLEEHIHSERCLPAQDNNDSSDPDDSDGPSEDATLICGKEEHVHDISCRSDSLELICGKEGHIHDRTCLSDYVPDEDGSKVDPDLDDPSLEPVAINETFEVPSDGFIMTFHIDGIALPMADDEETADPFDSWTDNSEEITPPAHQNTAVNTPSTPPKQETARPTAPSQDPKPSRPAENEEEPPVSEPPAETAPPANNVTPPEELDTEPELPPAPQLPMDVGTEGPGLVIFEDEEWIPEEDTPRSGRILSMNPESPDTLPSPPPEGSASQSDDTAAEPGENTTPPTESGNRPENNAAGTSTPSAGDSQTSGEIQFELVEVTEGEEYDALTAKINESVDEDSMIGEPQIMEIVATLNGQKLDLSGCQITVELKPSEELVEALESVAAVNTMELTDGEVVDGDGDTPSNPAIAVTLFTQDEDPQSKLVDAEEARNGTTMQFTFQSARRAVYARTTSFTPNPRFTVQFYANLNVPESTGGTLPFIDTSKTTGMGRLPQNGDDAGNRKVIKLGLNSDGSIKFNTKPVKIYSDESREFNPKLEGKQDVNYIDSLRDNEHYQLKELWVLKDVSTAADAASKTAAFDKLSSTEQAAKKNEYWDVKTVLDIVFTNNDELDGTLTEDGKTYLAVNPASVVRLVYDPVKVQNGYSAKATFYDFDITDGVTVNANKQNEVTTSKNGINSTLADGTDPAGQFAFGNNNAGTNYGGSTWNGGNQLNKYNVKNNNDDYRGCTFGLVTSMNSLGDVTFASGVNGPKNTGGQYSLFGEGTAVTGRTVYPKWNMKFIREGDTFTLTNVSMSNDESVASGLESLKHPRADLTDIWSNNFWPMDKKTNCKDPKFGAEDPWYYYNNHPGNKWFRLPDSDDHTAHNNYFGLKYSIDFTLVKEYVGPLEYYFYGDDDMWVFLTDKTTGKSTLVCDIGGVHSSVGEYVDLWDYIPGGKDKHELNNYTLNFFYTERGASGSTCWMQFTLPQISQIYKEPYVPENTSLSISKEVKSSTETELNQEFRFSLQLTGLSNRYQMNFYDANNVLDTERSGYISDARVEFTLKNGERVDVVELSPGVHYEVQELYHSDNCYTSVTGADKVTDDVMAEGDIVADQRTEVHYTNSFLYTLPSTGGPSARMYTFGGAALLLAAAGCLVYMTRSRRRGAADQT